LLQFLTTIPNLGENLSRARAEFVYKNMVKITNITNMEHFAKTVTYVLNFVE
jgi:hypothetical protein